ncbi:sortase domain-containing protein [Methanobacterium congolense]|uniref:Sortase (Surface protein transpeptidase) n=1 Tax=Methanobacterium congolense TaxID=118062 RepID=A0A1D3L0Q1_9EURY|nr:sortase [Methanobacterium congolense]SCG85059.1 Sortase (Surface protein transpeptidase) [Methanobacterium congolense]
MKKYLNYSLAIIVVLFLVVYATEGNNVEKKHFSGDGISFDYSATWESVEAGSHVAAFKDPNSGSNITVNKQFMPSDYASNNNFALNFSEAKDLGFKFVSSENITVDNLSGYKNSYEVNTKNSSIALDEIWVVKDGFLYSIIVKTPMNESNDKFSLSSLLPGSEEPVSSDIVTESFKIENSSNSTVSPFWGYVSIPSLGVNWGIRSDTVNALGSVYHYNESFYPGQDGVAGLLGHHTRFSAPFMNIDTLKTGDVVVVTDLLSQKRYTYQVSSSWDIKWDFKTNPVNFTAGNPELKLVTCWPKGYSKAAFQTHCKLVSIEPL